MSSKGRWFHVIEGTLAILVGHHWIHAPKGSFVPIREGTTHDFENRSATAAGGLNFSHPGGFEPHMPGVVRWSWTIPR